MISYYLNNQLANKIIKTFGDIETHLKILILMNIKNDTYEFEEVKITKEINVIQKHLHLLIQFNKKR